MYKTVAVRLFYPFSARRTPNSPPSGTRAMSSPAVSKSPVWQGGNPQRSSQRDLRRYKRFNFFTAANTLRKLHSSLPNNTESCRYKITRNLPAETLDDIVSYVDSQCDLLSLAWSCHEMHNLVFHAHFEHRVVKARVSSMRVWHRLAVCRTLARNVRHLEIVDGKSPEIIPTDITTTDTDVENTYDGSDLPAKREELLASAIAEMHGLKSLKWSHTDSLILIGSVWPTLRNCPNLTLVNLDDSTLFSPPKVQDPEEKEGDNHVDEDTAVRPYSQGGRLQRLTENFSLKGLLPFPSSVTEASAL